MDPEDDNQQQNDPLEERVEEIQEAGDDNANEEVEIEIKDLVQALEYDLVADKVLSFLNFEDMKALSAVSKNCRIAVRKTEDFAKRAGLTICKDSVQVLHKDSFKYRHVSIDLLLPALEVDQIAYLLPTVRTLSLWLSEILNLHLIEILSKTKNLKTLEMETSIFKNTLLDVLSNATVQETLGGLDMLLIRSKVAKQVCHIDAVENIENLPFHRNLRLLAEIPLKLKKFVFRKAVYANQESECRHLKCIPKIVNATKDTLEELELHLNVWKQDEMMEIRCSNLKRLGVSAYGTSRKDAEIVEVFLKNQPPLQELVIEMKQRFPLHIVQTFPGIVTQMNKLHIKAKHIFSITPVNWAFLETMDNNLKDFQIRKPTSWHAIIPDRYGSGEEILDKLPVGLEKISLQGFQPFWKEVAMVNLMPVVPPENIGDLLSRFVNLKEINLLRSGSAITNEGLQRVKTSEDGTAEERVGVSLNHLTRLTRLKIRACPNVSPEWMLRVVEFGSLRFFDYDGNLIEPKAFLSQIVRQNLCLEKVALRITNDREHGDEYLKETKEEMKATKARVRIINIPPTPNWEEVDSDSDASV